MHTYFSQELHYAGLIESSLRADFYSIAANGREGP